MLLLKNAVAISWTTNGYIQRRWTHSTPLPRCSNSRKKPNFSSPWWGPHPTLKCLDDVNYQIEKIISCKIQVVNYDRMKPYHGPLPVVSNVQTRPTTHTTGYRTHPVPNFDHSQRGEIFLLFRFAPQMTFLAPVNRQISPPNRSPNHVMDDFPNHTSASTWPLLASSAHQCSPTFSTRPIDYERRTPPHVLVKPRFSSSPRKLQSSSQSTQGTTFVQFPSRLEPLNGGVPHNLRQRLYSSPQSNSPWTLRTTLDKSFDVQASPATNISNTSRSLHSTTKQQRQRQPFFRAKLPQDLTEVSLPKKKQHNNRKL